MECLPSQAAFPFPGVGLVRVDQRFDTIQIAYRHSFTLTRLELAGGECPFDFYLGAAAGLGRARQTINSPPSALSAGGGALSASTTEWSGELAAGLQFSFGPHFGVRTGFRYLDSFNNVNQFGTGVNTDTKAIELGAFCRF